MKRHVIAFGLTILFLSACAAGDMGLREIHADIQSDLPNVSHITPRQLAKLDNPILLDIRETDEYLVSHLNGAIHVTPGTDIDELLATLGSIEGRPVVVYCSVGRRSSIFANHAQSQLLASGATQVKNLENGIFGWHNAERDLTNKKGQTDMVHPYNQIWKRYVRRKDKTAYTPK